MQAQKITTKSKSSFLSSFSILPKQKRDDIYIVYAWCRQADDIADDKGAPDDKLKRLNIFKSNFTRALTGRQSDELNTRAAEVIRRNGIPENYFHDLIRGMEMDINGFRPKTMEDLKLYCYRVAGVVGLMSIEIFGYRDSSTRRYAELLGLALQLTNILRDIGKDAIIKRVYLPEELLQRHQLDRHEIISGTYNDNFVNMAEELSEITRSYYQKAHAELSKTDYHPMLPSRIMAKVYFRILTELHRKRFNIFSYPETKVSKRYKYFIAFRLWLSDQLIPKSA